MSNILSEVLGDIPTIIGIAQQGAAFEAGQPININVPAETFTLDLSGVGIGNVKVTESGTTITIQKA
jgi:hypothetical protein